MEAEQIDVLRFGVYEADRRTGELRKAGVRIRIADQPFRVLLALLDRPGELITREELRRLLFADEQAGNFEQGVNRAINKLRAALCDSAGNPRFIETLPGHGYRFIAELERPAKPVEMAVPAEASPRFPLRPMAIFAALAACGMTWAVWWLIPRAVPEVRWHRLTTDNINKSAPAISDGARLYFVANLRGETFLAQIPVKGGQSSRLPITLPGPICNLQDISADRQDLLLLAGASIDRTRMLPLWTLQIADGTARRIAGVSATSAAYAPGEGRIAYTTATEVWLASAGGSGRRLAELKDSFLSNISWAPEGRAIRFSRQFAGASQPQAWQIGANGAGLEEVLPRWRAVSLAPSGWTPDGAFELFTAQGSVWLRRSSGWRRWVPDDAPARTTDGELEFSGQIRNIRGNSSFAAVGIDRLGELQQYNYNAGDWRPLLDGISAEAAEFSRDGARVSYVSYPQRILWVRDADGNRPIQVTSPPMIVTAAHWSPDGRRLAITAQEDPGKPTRIYLVDADGGTLRAASPGDYGWQDDPSWSVDGKTLLYGLKPHSAREQPYIRSLDLETGAVSKLPGSENLFAPYWSPKGDLVAAIEWDSPRRLMVYRFADRKWSNLTGDRADWPQWNPDGKTIFYKNGDRLIEERVNDERIERSIPIRYEEFGGYLHAIGISGQGAPIRTLNRDGRQVYELSFQ